MYNAHDCPYNGPSMNRKILVFYYIISLIFLLVVLVLSAWRFKVARDTNLTRAENAFSDLKVAALSTYLAEGSFSSEYFKYAMRQQSAMLPRLLAVAIYSRQQGVEYLWARRGNLLLNDPAAAPGLLPQYRLQDIRDRLLTASFDPTHSMDAVFRVLEWEDLAPLLRELFYLLVAFLVVTVVVLVAASSARQAYLPLAPGRWSAAAAPKGGLSSPESGLGLREHLPARLEHELERAASSDQDLCLLLLAVDPRQPASAFQALARQVLAGFPFRDLCFEYDGRTCAVILPEKDLSQALKDARAFRRRLSEMSWPGGRPTAVSLGLSARNGRLIDSGRLLLESSTALQRAEAEGAGRIVAFQADPEKFRRSLASEKIRAPRAGSP
jgi:GGDEF domain-containing protein